MNINHYVVTMSTCHPKRFRVYQVDSSAYLALKHFILSYFKDQEQAKGYLEEKSSKD